MSALMKGEAFHRRTLLRGISLSGALLFGSLARRSVAQTAAGNPNLLFFYSPNGSLRDEFGADGTATAFTLRPSLSALQPWKSRIHVIQDINNLGYVSNPRSVSHSNITRILTCVEGTDPNVAAGPSVDHVIAQKLGQTPLVLGVHPVSNSVTYHNKLSWAAAGVATNPVLDSLGTFNRLFPTTPGSTTPSDAARQNARTRSILDYVRGDLTTLKGRLGPGGRDLLDIHATSLRELEASLVQSEVEQMVCDLTGLKSSVQTPLPASPAVSRKSYLWTPVLTAHGRLQMDLIAMALACGVRRVATLVWQPCSMEGVNPAGTVHDVGHHDVSHWSVSDFAEKISRDQARAQYVQCDRFYAQQYAYLLGKLQSLGILGDTFVPWVTETRDAGHQQGRFHIVVGGGDAHGIKTNRFTQYSYGGGNDPKTVLSNRSFADLWVSAHKMMGIAPPKTGGKEHFGPPQFCKGAGLEEVY